MKLGNRKLWDELISSQHQALLPWRDAHNIMLQMQSIATGDERVRELIRVFGSTYSASHASALCGALVIYVGQERQVERFGMLLDYFSMLRLRSYEPVIGTLISKTCFLIQRYHLIPEQQDILVHFCFATLDLCEQMSPEDWKSGRSLDLIDRTELILQNGLSHTTKSGQDGQLLIRRIERARAMAVTASRQ